MNKILSLLGALLLCVALPTLYVAPALLVTQTGCASLHGDPVVINAERAIKIGFDVCDAFVTFEHQNNDRGQLGPAIRKAADDVRRQAPTWIRLANVMLDSYQAAVAAVKTAAKEEKVAANERVKAAQAGLAEALKTLQSGQDEAVKQLAEAQKLNGK